MATFNDLIQPIANMITELIGDPMLIGATIFLFVTYVGMLVFLPFEAMVVVWVPLTFLVGVFIPALRIVLGIMLGILIGIGLIKWIRR